MKMRFKGVRARDTETGSSLHVHLPRRTGLCCRNATELRLHGYDSCVPHALRTTRSPVGA